MHTLQSGAVDTAGTGSMRDNIYCGNTDTHAFSELSLHTTVKRVTQRYFLPATATSGNDL